VPLLPRFAAETQKREDDAKIDKLVRESDPGPLRLRAGATSGGDRRRLRGIPVVAKAGVGGTMFGTSPLDAVIAKEGQRRR